MTSTEVLGRVSGPVVIIGFGSIGRGVLPLLDRHIDFDRTRCTVIDPDDRDRHLLDEYGVGYRCEGITVDNYTTVLPALLTEGEGQGFCINLSVDTSSVDIMRLCRELGVLYIDTVVEPWPGFYYDSERDNATRTNHALRQLAIDERRRVTGRHNGGLVLRRQPGDGVVVRQGGPRQPRRRARPRGTGPSGRRSRRVGAVHARPRGQGHPHRRARHAAGCAAEAARRLLEHLVGRGLHQRGPAAGRARDGAHTSVGCRRTAARSTIRRRRRSTSSSPAPTRGCARGARRTAPSTASSSRTTSRCRSPTSSPSATTTGSVEYRPTCHYAYHPCNDAVLSFDELFGAGCRMPADEHVLDEHEIVDGSDELGVLLYGHARNAYWFGSQLTIEEARQLAPHQNATGLQVTSAVLAGVVWALENPLAGIVETDDMDHVRCLEVQTPVPRHRRRLLHRLDPTHRPPGPVRRGHRSRRPVAVPQRACSLNPARSAGG